MRLSSSFVPWMAAAFFFVAWMHDTGFIPFTSLNEDRRLAEELTDGDGTRPIVIKKYAGRQDELCGHIAYRRRNDTVFSTRFITQKFERVSPLVYGFDEDMLTTITEARLRLENGRAIDQDARARAVADIERNMIDFEARWVRLCKSR